MFELEEEVGSMASSSKSVKRRRPVGEAGVENAAPPIYGLRSRFEALLGRETPSPDATTMKKGDTEEGTLLTPESVLVSGMALKTPPIPIANATKGSPRLPPRPNRTPAGGRDDDGGGALRPLNPLPELDTTLELRPPRPLRQDSCDSFASGAASGSDFDSPVPTLRTGDLNTPRTAGLGSFAAPPSVLRQRRVYSVTRDAQAFDPLRPFGASDDDNEGHDDDVGVRFLGFGCGGEEGGREGEGEARGGESGSGTINRTCSLDETKVLAATRAQSSLLRSESIVIPELFMHMGHFDFIRRIGSSQCSEVWLVRHKYNGKLFAVKQRHYAGKGQRETCAREMRSVADLPPHENIVFYYRAWQEDSYVFTQMEYCEGGTLRSRMAAAAKEAGEGGGGLGCREVLRLASEVAGGLSFLEGQGVLHLDVKPENILLDAEGTYHIADFGLAVRTGDAWEEGDGRYLAPELLNDDAQATPKADVYSFGAVLYECLCGLGVARNRVETSEEEFKARAKRCLVDEGGAPDQLAGLVIEMLSLRPEDRPAAREVVQRVLILER